MFDFDIVFLLSSLFVFSFIIVYLVNNIGTNNLYSISIDTVKLYNPIHLMVYFIANNLYTQLYDAYNKYRIWIFYVEF